MAQPLLEPDDEARRQLDEERETHRAALRRLASDPVALKVENERHALRERQIYRQMVQRKALRDYRLASEHGDGHDGRGGGRSRSR